MNVSKDEEARLLAHSSQSPNTDFTIIKSKGSFLQRDLFPFIPARYVLVVIASLGFINVYALRVNLSMAIVTMVNSSANHSTRLQYDWSSQQQGWVLSSFFFGYLITQIPGGYLASKYGGRYIFGVGIFMTSVLTLLTPLAAEIHIGVLIALRVLEGLFEGVTFPAMHSILGKWSPLKERTIMATIVYSGPVVGNVISFPISALLCEYGFAGGWPSVFYVFGSVGVFWFIFWLFLGYSSPHSHPRISEKEIKYIEANVGSYENKNRTPWMSIFTSPAVWAIIIAFMCNNWGNYTLLTCIPLYYKEALGLSFGKSLIDNGIFSAIPYLAYAIVALSSGQVADFLRRNGLSTVIVRKMFTTLSMFLAAGGLVSVGYIGSNKIISVTFLTISVGCSAFAQAGYNINHIDIAPQYAGILMGITNTAGTIPGIVAPIVAKMISHKPLPGEKDLSVYQEEWREVFIIAAEVYVFGAIVYIILGRGERQWWAGGKEGVIEETSLIKESVHSINTANNYIPNS